MRQAQRFDRTSFRLQKVCGGSKFAALTVFVLLVFGVFCWVAAGMALTQRLSGTGTETVWTVVSTFLTGIVYVAAGWWTCRIVTRIRLTGTSPIVSVSP